MAVPPGNDVVATVGAALTTIDNACSTDVTLFASFTVTEKLKVPDALGVPETTPVPLASDNPVGNAPDETVQFE